MSELIIENFKDVNRAKPVYKRVEKVVETIKHKTPAFIDSLSLLFLIVLYFSFTGLAIVVRSPLPKEWLQIGVGLNKKRISKLIEAVAVDQPLITKSPVKIVNIQKEPPVDLLK